MISPVELHRILGPAGVGREGMASVFAGARPPGARSRAELDHRSECLLGPALAAAGRRRAGLSGRAHSRRKNLARGRAKRRFRRGGRQLHLALGRIQYGGQFRARSLLGGGDVEGCAHVAAAAARPAGRLSARRPRRNARRAAAAGRRPSQRSKHPLADAGPGRNGRFHGGGIQGGKERRGCCRVGRAREAGGAGGKNRRRNQPPD